MGKKEGIAKAIAILVGTTIGAGVLGMPYVISKAGFLTGLVDILILGAVILLINLCVGEVVLRTKSVHQLTGYAEKYLGKKGKALMTLSMAIGIYGALLAYIIGVGEALGAIFGINQIYFSLGFFVIASALVYKGIKSVAETELLFGGVVISLILLIGVIAIFSGKLDTSNLTEFSLSKIFVPYGVILFAFVGASSIPEIGEVLRKERKTMKKSIIIGSLIPIIIYSFFAFAIVGVFGTRVTEVASIGLGLELGKFAVLMANLFAVLAMSTSFLTLGLALVGMYNYDYKFSKFSSWSLACFLPLILFLFGFKSFINVIGTTGIIAGGIEGTLIVLMLWSSKKKGDRKPEYEMNTGKILGSSLIIVFVLGVLQYLYGLI